VPVLLHHLVGEERHGHDAPHLAPVVAVHGEHHVLPFPREDVEHHVAGAGAELHALRVEHLPRQRRRGHHHQVALPHPEEEDVAEFSGQRGQVAVVEVVADLQPVAEDGHGDGAGRQPELAATHLGHRDGDHDGREEADQELLHEEKVHGDGGGDGGRAHWFLCVCVIFGLPPEPMKKWAVVPAFLESPTDMYVRIYREPAVMGSWR